MDVLVIGSIVVDLISYSVKFPEVSQTILGSSFQQGFGGKGANQAFVAGLLGAKSGIVGKVGNDLFGELYLNKLKKFNIDTNNIQVSKNTITGAAVIMVRTGDGANQIVIVPGANFEMTIEDVYNAKDAIKNSKIIMCQLEIPLVATLESIRLANQMEVPVLLNPAPTCIKGTNLINQLLDHDLYVFVFCPNETEATALLADIDIDLTVCDIESAQEAIRHFLRLFNGRVRYPMVTMGGLGVVFGDSSDKQIYRVPAPTTDAVDTTGAGDCFAGSLGYFISKSSDLTIHEQVERSVYLASISVQSKGTQDSFPDNGVLIEKGWA